MIQSTDNNRKSAHGRPQPRRPRVLLSAYSCCPNWGSEPGVGWNRATSLARYCDVWVLTNQNGMQPRIEAYLDEHGPVPNLEFVYVPRKPWELAISRKAMLKYIAYRSWLRRAFGVARRLHTQVGFDIAHHVTFNGFREPSYLYRLGVPFVWGPVGGAQNYPWRFLAGAGVRGAISEATRSTLNTLQLYASSRVRRAAKSAAAIFTANPETQSGFQLAMDTGSFLLCDVGSEPSNTEAWRPHSNAGKLRIAWAGNLATWKALELLLEALAILPKTVRYELHILGEGPRRDEWQSLAAKRGIAANVRWYGRLPHDEALDHFRRADVFIFTSLRDTSGTVVLEAFAEGTPVICLDHQGVSAIVTPECGIKIPVTNRRDVHHRLRDAIALLHNDRSLCRKLAQGARQRASVYLWSLQARRIAEQYNRILASVGSDAHCRLELPTEFATDFWHEAPITEPTARV
jgi:glycosyltransferase involved in cell wall biosynthesis